MRKRYISLILVILCLLVVSSAGFGFAKYKTEKSQVAFTLSSNVAFRNYTYAVLGDDGALSIRSREAMVGSGKLIEADGTSYNLSQVYRLPDSEFDSSTPAGAKDSWTTNNSVRGKITSVTVDDDIQLQSADVSEWCRYLTICTKLDLSRLTLSAPITFTSSYIYNSPALTDVSLPENVTAIGADCFNKCEKLVSVTLPDGVTSIGNNAFQYLKALTTLNLGTGLKTVGNNAFQGCTALTEVKLGNEVTTIGLRAFKDCTALTGVGLDENTPLKKIDEEAFQNCINLESISLTDTIESLGIRCFSECISLTEVHIPQNLKIISEGLFSGCENLTVDTEKLIPDSVKYVNGDAFRDCKSITAEVIIGSQVDTLGSDAFSGCSSITVITLPDDKISSCGGNVFEGTGVTEVEIPSKFFSEGRIRSGLFKDCKNLTKVTIADGISNIDNEAFSGCENITEINIPNTVTRIGVNAFYNVNNIYPLTLSENVGTIGQQAFGSDDGSLRVIFYNGTAAGPENWGNVIVVNSANLGSVPTCTLNGDTSSMNITLPAGVSTDQLSIRIGQNTADGFVSDSEKLVEKNEDGTFDIPVVDVTQKLIILSVPEKVQYAVYSQSTNTLYFLNDILIKDREYIPGTNNDRATAVYEDILGSAEGGDPVKWSEYAGYIETVTFVGKIAPIDMTDWFRGCKELTAINGMATHLDTSKVMAMHSTFSGCEKLTVLDLSGFDTGKVGDMKCMFEKCSKLKTIYVSEMFVTQLLWDDTVPLFVECGNLVGGNDMTFDNKKTSKNYARIDGQDGQSGYFTGIVQPKIDTESLPGVSWSFYGTSNFKVDKKSTLVLNGVTENFTAILTSSDDTIAEAEVEVSMDESGIYRVDIPAEMMKSGTSFTISKKEVALNYIIYEDGLVHLTATCDPAEIIPGEAFTITLTPDAGYILPETVTVTINGEDKTTEVAYVNGVITIPAKLITEGITISVTAEAKQQITVSIGEGLTATSGVPIPGEAFTVTLTGEALPDGVTVTIDGVETSAAVYDKATGIITIPGELLTSATRSITITEAAAPEASTAICNCTTQCTAENAKGDCPVCGATPENCSPVVCTCETRCAEDAANAECSVCGTNAANCSPKEPETTAVCGCTVKCAEDNPDSECAVCTGGGACLGCTCENKCDTANENCPVCQTEDGMEKCQGTDSQPAIEPSDPTEPETPTITMNTNGISNLSFSPDADPAINQDYIAGMAPVEGYILPETITVTIGADRYTVNLSGENEDGKPDFEGGKLIIPGTLLTGETTITIEAAGVAAVPADEDNSGEETQPPADENNSGKETQPSADENNSGKETQPPADENNSGEETQPSADEDSSGEETQPLADDIPDENTQPSPDENTQPPAGEETKPPADNSTQPPADNGTQPPAGGNNDVPEQPEQSVATEGGSTEVDPPTE